MKRKHCAFAVAGRCSPIAVKVLSNVTRKMQRGATPTSVFSIVKRALASIIRPLVLRQLVGSLLPSEVLLSGSSDGGRRVLHLEVPEIERALDLVVGRDVLAE